MFEKMTTLNENVAVLFGNIFTHDYSLPPTVWPDWVIFESSWLQIF